MILNSKVQDKISRAVRALRKIYPDVVVTSVKIGKNKVKVYGKARNHWFKMIIDREGKARVYSSSRSIEFVAKKELER